MQNQLAGDIPLSLPVGFLLLTLTFVSLIAAETSPATDDIFRSTNLLRIAIEIPAEGVQILQGAFGGRSAMEKPEAQCTVIEGGRVYTNVSVQLKGFTSFDSIDRRPSLTLNFNKIAPKQKFHGLTKISLNNSYQDITRLHEKLSRELFAAAGVPVPQADYAVVTLNGRDLGLYVLAEGFSKEFLKRHFKRADGTLYEGGILQDINHGLRINFGQPPTNNAIVQRLINASGESDVEKRLSALEAVLDVDRFISMMAMETILCHSDTYSMNRNNYRIYHDPATDKLVFMPHGMDRVLGAHRSYLDLSVVPPVLGIVAQTMLSTPEGRRRHVERVGIFVTNLFDPDRLCARVHEWDARIISEKKIEPPNRRFERMHTAAEDADNLCQRISQRASELKFQLSNVPELLVPPSIPKFDTNGFASIENWKPKLRANQPAPLTMKTKNQIWHLRSTNGPLVASFHSRIALLPGNYQLSGACMATNSAGETNLMALTMVRYSTDRFAIERQSLNGRSTAFRFQINQVRNPDEIEFVCEIRDRGAEAWFDGSGLKLSRN